MPLPSRCALCLRWSAQALCVDCLRWAAAVPRCAHCGLRTGVPQARCGHCLPHPWSTVRTWVAVDYGFPWDQLVQRLKFQQDTALAAPMAALMAPSWQREPVPLDGLVPLPLSTQRLAERGYNQASLLAQALARQLDLPVFPQALMRWRDSALHQVQLSRAERLQHLSGAFMPHPTWRSQLKGLRLALVDDVLTTGASIQAATLALQEAGVQEVSAWVFARTPAPGSG